MTSQTYCRFASCFLLVLICIGQIRADERAKLDEIAKAFDENLVDPYPCWIVRHRNLNEGKELAEFFYLGDDLLVRIGDVVDGSGDDADIHWKTVRMRNGSYFASLTRSRDTDKWQMRAFANKGEAMYESVTPDIWRAEHPSGRWLLLAPLPASEYLRKCEIISRSTTRENGTDVDVWTVQYTPEGREEPFPERKVRITQEPPYRLIGFSQNTYEMKFRSFHTEGDSSYPTEIEYIEPRARGGASKPAHLTINVESRDLDGTFDKDALYLSYYGLPEPGGSSNNLWFIVVAVIAVVIGIAGYKIRRA